MSTFLFASIPVPAHTTNPIPFAQRLVERGHTVLWYAGKVFHDQFAAVGATPLPYAAADDFGGVEIERVLPAVRRTLRHQSHQDCVRRRLRRPGPAPGGRPARNPGPARGRRDAVRRPDVRRRADQRADRCPVGDVRRRTTALLRARQPAVRPGAVADARSARTRPQPGRRLGRTHHHLRRGRSAATTTREPTSACRRHDRPVLEESVSPYLHLHGARAVLRLPAASSCRRTCTGSVRCAPTPRPTGPGLTGGPRSPRRRSRWSWSPRAASGPTSPSSSRRPSTRWPTPTYSSSSPPVRPTPSISSARTASALPGNVRVAKFVPYDLLLPHVSCFVTNGGYTGVTLALHHGVPLVQAGTTEEKSEIAARIAWTGVGQEARHHPAPAPGRAPGRGRGALARAVRRRRRTRAGGDGRPRRRPRGCRPPRTARGPHAGADAMTPVSSPSRPCSPGRSACCWSCSTWRSPAMPAPVFVAADGPLRGGRARTAPEPGTPTRTEPRQPSWSSHPGCSRWSASRGHPPPTTPG